MMGAGLCVVRRRGSDTAMEVYVDQHNAVWAHSTHFGHHSHAEQQNADPAKCANLACLVGAGGAGLSAEYALAARASKRTVIIT